MTPTYFHSFVVYMCVDLFQIFYQSVIDNHAFRASIKMDAVKEDLCLFNELLYSMSGFYNFQVDPKRFATQLNDFERTFSSLNCFPLVKDLLGISILYYKVNVFLIEYSTSINEFYFLLHEMISESINNSYIKDLVSFDYYHKLNNANVFELTRLLKYKQFFTDILNVVNDLKDENKILALFKLTSTFEVKYDIKIDRNYDPFFQGIWTWLIRGTLPINHKNSFFISLNSDDNYSLDFLKFPDSIEPKNAIQIHRIGNLVRYINLHGIETNFHHSQIYWKCFQERTQFYNSPILFRFFLNDVKKFVFENILKVTKLKESYFDYIHQLKTFCLYGNECFWTNFVYILTISDLESDIQVVFRNAIYATFDYSTADHYSNCINIKISKRYSSPLKLTFKQSPLLNILISENTLNKYHSIFEHLYKLHSTRYFLIFMWKERDLTNEFTYKQWHLYHSLLRTFSTFFVYCKFCIEYFMKNYFESIENTVEIDEIQSFHDTCLLDIINRLFIKNSFIINLQNNLVELAYNIIKPEQTIDSLLKEYNQIMEAFRSSFQLSRKHVNIFDEMLETI